MTIGRGLIVILGNSGAGKSTLAHWLARELGAARQPLPHLDLDTVAWLPHQIAAARPPTEAEAMLRDWMARHPRGVLEGCYGALARVAIAAGAALIWLDPGVEQCLAHCRARPFEAHKYPDPQTQQAHLERLLDWVRDYPHRAGDLGRADHAECFADCPNPKLRLEAAVDFRHPPEALRRWLAEA